MATYATDELVFDLPDGFADRSITVLSSTKSGHPMSIVVNREPAQPSLAEQVKTTVAAIQKAAPQTKVLGQRDREVGNLAAREVKMSTVAGKQSLYVRQAYVPYYGTLLSISVTALRTQQPFCDSIAEKLLTGTQFRKR